jgi:CRISPR-associated endonuclease/helicase Cas3
MLAKITQVKEYLDDTAPLSSEERRFAALVRLLTVAADVAGSAIPRSGESLTWVRDALSTYLSNEDLEGTIRSSLNGREPYQFQHELQAVEGEATLVSVGCGGGKTIGAYMWASTNAVGKKLIFCYPTTGTVTQGFLDYLQGVDGAGLHHSRAVADIVDLQLSEGLEEVGHALASLRAWPSKVLACTVDTVLGALHFNSMGMFSSPVFANSAFVFDEIHLYDDLMFGLLLRFLELFPCAPMLLMTASLQPTRLALLRRRMPRLREISNAESEAVVRYRLRPPVLEEVPWGRVEEVLRAGGKVLIICNRVNDAIYRSYEANKRGFRPITYHSRFRYEDRRRRHEEVVSAFRSDGPALAVTTQVAEVSLDISADLLVTDIAPAEALIQRLGRLNRYLRSSFAEAYAVQAEALPYSPDELARGLAFWGTCTSQDRLVSQAELAAELSIMVGTDAKDPPTVCLLDGKFDSDRSSIREPGYTRTAFLDIDFHRLEQSLVSRTLREEFIRCAIPIPTNWTKDGLCTNQLFLNSYPVVNTRLVRYTSLYGAISFSSRYDR